MSSMLISVANDFSPSPAGRYRTDGPFPGEEFRDRLLIPALKERDEVTVDLDGTDGFGSSFLEEAFGGLVRKGFTEAQLKLRMRIKSARQSYALRVWVYIHEASH